MDVAMAAPEAKYWLGWKSRTLGLHDQLAAIQVIAAGKYHPARVLQDFHLVCMKLSALNANCWSPCSHDIRHYFLFKFTSMILSTEAKSFPWNRR